MTTKTKKETVINKLQATTAISAPIYIKPLESKRFLMSVHALEPNKPYCPHKMDQKAILQIQQKQDGITPTSKKEPKDQWKEFMGAGYWIRDAKGVIQDLAAPAIQFKRATVDAVRHVGDRKTLTMAAIRSWFHIRSTDIKNPDFVALKSDPLEEYLFDDMDYRFTGQEEGKQSQWVNKDRIKEMKRFHKKGISISRHPVTVGMGMDLRYRPKIYNWTAEFIVEFKPQFISEEGLVNLINIGGSLNGIGEWRPSSPKACGDWGMFEVSTTAVETIG